MTTIALVTGAASGIGFEVVRQLGEGGATVILTARNLAKAEAAVAKLSGSSFVALALDVADEASVVAAAHAVEERFGRLDVLVNNAAGGFDYTAKALEVDLADVAATLQINVFSVMHTVRAFRPLLAKSAHPRVVNVSSGAGSHSDGQFGLHANPASLPGYAVSKAALNALTVILAKELKGERVLVNAACPGLTNSHPEMMTIPGARDVATGARSIVWATRLDDNGPTGGFFRDGAPLGW